MERYQLLVRCDRVGTVIEDWLLCGTCDLTLRMARTEGCRVIETTDALYAARIVKWLQAAEKVNIKRDQQ